MSIIRKELVAHGQMWCEFFDDMKKMFDMYIHSYTPEEDKEFLSGDENNRITQFYKNFLDDLIHFVCIEKENSFGVEDKDTDTWGIVYSRQKWTQEIQSIYEANDKLKKHSIYSGQPSTSSPTPISKTENVFDSRIDKIIPHIDGYMISPVAKLNGDILIAQTGFATSYQEIEQFFKVMKSQTNKHVFLYQIIETPNHILGEFAIGEN